VFAALVVLAGLLLSLWLWLRGPDIPYAKLIDRYAGSDSAFIDLPGDIRLHYRVAGSESRPAGCAVAWIWRFLYELGWMGPRAGARLRCMHWICRVMG
jgi:hypothetical protein